MTLTNPTLRNILPIISREWGIYGFSKKNRSMPLGATIDLYRKFGGVDFYRFMLVCNAFGYLRTTGRLDGTTELYIKNLTPYQLLKTLCQIATNQDLKATEYDFGIYLRNHFMTLAGVMQAAPADDKTPTTSESEIAYLEHTTDEIEKSRQAAAARYAEIITEAPFDDSDYEPDLTEAEKAYAIGRTEEIEKNCQAAAAYYAELALEESRKQTVEDSDFAAFNEALEPYFPGGSNDRPDLPTGDGSSYEHDEPLPALDTVEPINIHPIKGKSFKDHAAYRAGYQGLMLGAAISGRAAISPSTQEKLDWGRYWGTFMAGWRQAQKDFINGK